MAGRLSLPDEDDTYFISINDMMIGLVFLFIIILMAFALNLRTAEDTADKTLAELRQERDQLEKERDRLRAQRDMLRALTTRLIDKDALRDQLLAQIRDRLAARGIHVVVEPEKGVLRLPESLLFPTARAELSDRGREALAALAEVMVETMPCYAIAPEDMRGDCEAGGIPILETVLVEGHTDDRPIHGGTFADNWDLSAARGVSTFKALTEYAAGLERLSNDKNETLLGVAGYEARRPVASGSDDAARRMNRRIDLRFVVSAPTSDELGDLELRLDELMR